MLFWKKFVKCVMRMPRNMVIMSTSFFHSFGLRQKNSNPMDGWL